MQNDFFDKNICLLALQRSLGGHDIFKTSLDYRFYINLMKQYKRIFRVRIFAYCLLESAIYLIVSAKDMKNITDFLSEVNRSFCEFITVRDQERASLCILRSRMIVAEDDQSLIDLVGFVEAFPVKLGLVTKEKDYEYSSFRLRALGIDSGVIEHLNLCL